MERLSESSLLADSQKDPRSSGWLTDNIWNPFVNGTGVKQIYNNFTSEKLEPNYVPEAKTLSTDWVVHSLASAGGAVLTYAVAGKAAGMGLGYLGSKLGLEGTAAKVLSSHATAQIVGAGLYDFAKAPNPGETRIGNMAGSLAAFSVFSGGNYLLGTSKAIAGSSLYTGLGRVAVGAVGGLTSLETSHFVSGKLGAEAEPLNWDHRFKAMAGGGFINFALPPISRTISNVVDGALNSKTFKFPTAEEAKGTLQQESAKATTKSAILRTNIDEIEARGSEAELPRLILLKQQFNDTAREAQMIRVAGEVAGFIKGANQSLHTALYDLRLHDPRLEKLIIDALNDRAEANVDVKLAFFKPNPKPEIQAGSGPGNAFARSPVANFEPGEIPISGPSAEFLQKLSPKIKTQLLTPTVVDNVGKAAESAQIPDAYGAATSKSAAAKPPELGKIIDVQKGDSTGLENIDTAGITGGGKLMHHKYMVRDAGTKDGAVWTGSTNITGSAFGMQDNNIVIIKSRAIADVFSKNFNELWTNGDLRGTGKDLHTMVNIAGGGTVSIAFSPGDGAWIEAEYARMIADSKSSVYLASMVISSPEILQALADAKANGVPIAGIYDGPQMRNVVRAWKNSQSEASAEKLANWNKVKQFFIPKNSHPYSPEGPHDFMHNKTLAVDGEKAATGSFNFSMNATKNAENVLIFNSPTVAMQYQNYIQDLIQTYGKSKAAGSPVAKPAGQ